MMTKQKRFALTGATTMLVLIGAVTFLPLRAIAGLETPCTFISNLVATNPLSSDLASTGDDHLRCIKVAVTGSFPGVSGAVTSTHTELNVLDGITSTTAELNILDGVTATAAELNALDGITATVTELNYTDGVTSAIQTQLNAKLASASYTAADVLTKLLTVDGAGSGVDADLLDGSSSAAFAQLAAANTFTAVPLTISAAQPDFRLVESDATADNGVWRIFSNGENFRLIATNDAGSVSTNFVTVERTGTTVDSINLAATTVQTNGVNITASESSFTATLTGMSSATTGTLDYRIVAQVVTLWAEAAITGTSNSTSFTVTGLPAAIRPSAERWVFCFAMDNGTVYGSRCEIETGGTITLTKETDSGGTTWTASGTKGFQGGAGGGFTVVYPL